MGKGTFMKGKMLAKALQAVENGWIPEQIWMKAARRMQEEPIVTKKAKERKPEDAFVESYLHRHPETEFIALDLTSPEHPANKFAARQMELMKAFDLKHTKQKKKLACAIVEAEMLLEDKLKEERTNIDKVKAYQEGRKAPSMKKTVLQKAHEEALRHHLAGVRKMKRQYEAASIECAIPFKDAFPEAKRWDERDEGGTWSEAFGEDFRAGRI